MSIEYPDLSDYLAVAAAVTGSEPATPLRSTKLDLGGLGTPRSCRQLGRRGLLAGLRGQGIRAAGSSGQNHPLLDGKKRAAWVTLRLFIEMNGWTWSHYPGVDDAEHAVLAVASSEWDEDRTAAWLRAPVAAPSSSD